ncbi:MAG: TetR/AcrR family transcriptional regulator [Steroidobacteraceae bacterium]
MGQENSRTTLAKPLPAKQARSRKTRDALLAAGWKLLARHAWDDITINDIVTAAGVSVGSFYTRFTDRDAYFESLAAEWVARRGEERMQALQHVGRHQDYMGEAILDTYRTALENRNFWRAALMRGAAHPVFWRQFREMGLRVLDRLLELREAELGRPLTEKEKRHFHFAIQMANGLINNSIVNRPGPVMPGTPEFETELVRGLKAVAGIA